MCKKPFLLALAAVLFLLLVLPIAFNFSPGLAAKYYSQQNDFIETFVPMTRHRWDKDDKAAYTRKKELTMHTICGQAVRAKVAAGTAGIHIGNQEN